MPPTGRRICRRSIIGHHGETMARLLRPGFHSGTLPKRFAKLRRAERKAREKGKWQAVRKHLQAIGTHRVGDPPLCRRRAAPPAFRKPLLGRGTSAR